MTSESKPQRHEAIEFHFLTSDEESTLMGTVLIRGQDMVLDIRDPHGDLPYLVSGIFEDGYYQGTNSAIGAENSVDARWASVGSKYVGLWVEGGADYYFSFRLPGNIGAKKHQRSKK